MTDQSPSMEDDLQPARAIRRALAASGLKAREVGLIAVWATGPLAREQSQRAITRGLGRFAAGVTTVIDDPDPFARCAAAVASGEADVAVALTIDPVAGSVAQAFGLPARIDRTTR